METTKEYDQMIVDKITALIYPKYLTEAKVELMVCKNATNNIKVSFGVNPWRYGLTKGAMPFASINSSAINPSITFFGKFSEDFSKLGMNYTEEKTYTVRTCINVDLQEFITHLNNPTDEFVKIINRIFISNVSFPEFGCCSKYSECEKAGKCLHTDQLYATACQYQKSIKRTGKSEKGKSIIEFPKDYVVIDLETTGLSPEWDKIIEIGALKVLDGKIIDTFQQLVYPGMEIDKFIEQLTGITNEMLEGKPWIDDVLPEFEKFVEDNIVVGHNVNFDVNFLYEDYETVLKRPFKNNFIDTMRIARKLYPELSHHRLIDIVEHLNIKGSATHRALNDCEYTYKCYEAMKNEIERRYVSFEYFSTQFKKTDLTKLTAENDEFDETNPLYKKQCVFTGTLERYSRQEAAQIVVNLGGMCGNSVTKKTNYLILGNNDYCSSIKDGKSNKQKKAEEYKLKGQDIEVIPENVFYEMIEQE